jgi:uncharacterized protein YggE
VKHVGSAILIVLALSSLAIAQRPETANDPVIVVNGEGEVRVAPDQAMVRIGVVRQAPTAQAAQDQANTAANEILSSITRLGVAAADVKTSRLTLTPVYAPRSPESSQAPRIVAYQASNTVSVRLSDLNRVGPTIDAALKAGSNEIQGVSFGLRDDSAARQQALKQAVMQAQKKAETIAEAARLVLGAPLEITESGVSFVPHDNFEMPMMRAVSAAPVPTQVSPGDMEVRANVMIRYKIGGPRP